MLKRPTVPAVIVKPETSAHPLREKLSKDINGPAFVADLLLQRGIEEKEQARDFFLAMLGTSQSEADNPRMLGMEKALALLLRAREAGEKVFVHGDYDVDGVTATALLYQGLRHCGFNADWFLPNRFQEGYGISHASVGKLSEQGARWLVSVDTGISAVAEVAKAKELGMGVIITDHHQSSGELPPADAILNPNQPGCPYPNKGLSGVGVAYKLLNALTLALKGETAERFLDLLALGSLADNVPLVGENRRLVKAGLKVIAASPNLGIRALMERVGVERNRVSSGEILFKVTPMLNAMGRMGSPEISARLLLSETEEEAAGYLDQMVGENNRRRKLDQGITEQAVRLIDDDPVLTEAGCLVVASPEWHEGVIGIVAARLVERYRRPCFVLAIDADKGLAKGSGRTLTGFNLHKALAGAAHLLDKWGGHYHACGLTIKAERIPAFRDLMNAAAAEHLAGNDFVPRISPTVEIALDGLNEESMQWLQRFEPFGPLNESPLFYSEDVELLSTPKVVGDKHLKFMVGSPGAGFDAIGFNLGYLRNYVMERPKLARIAYYPEWNSFRGERRIQLRIVALE
ncbi:MAG TPA: single-stranded-DNA-specific exonuclease RecJ [Fibrobacteria bacterium]|nr:single-stranded-DNA-specific exonuclease RecJ [Fibrobacteria bacterium]